MKLSVAKKAKQIDPRARGKAMQLMSGLASREAERLKGKMNHQIIFSSIRYGEAIVFSARNSYLYDQKKGR